MADHIELKSLNDHDLLVMVAVSTNEMERHLEKLNSSVEKHQKELNEQDKRICKVETSSKDNRKLVIALWSVTGSISLALLVLMIEHILGA